MAEDLERLTNRYVCARCWQPLVILRQADGTEIVECSNRENCNGKGYVTKRYAEQRRSDSWFERLEVLINYPQLSKSRMANRVKSEQELLSELGF
jgi:DNA-directed RNA polymerase subunit RPC12/RpoP